MAQIPVPVAMSRTFRGDGPIGARNSFLPFMSTFPAFNLSPRWALISFLYSVDELFNGSNGRVINAVELH